MLNKICDLEDQIENLNDLTKKMSEKVFAICNILQY